MTAQDAFRLYKKIKDEVDASDMAPQSYAHYQLKDERKLKIFQELANSGMDLKQFFLSNIILQKSFFIDYFPYNRDKCISLYHSWPEFLVKKHKEYFHRVICEIKKAPKLNLEDRDAFLEMVPVTDYLFFSAAYPEDLELLTSIDTDWLKFHMPEYECPMDYISRVIKGNMVLKNMPLFGKLRDKILPLIHK